MVTPAIEADNAMGLGLLVLPGRRGAGYEVAVVYGAIAAILGYTGPGRWSLDTLICIGAHGGYVWGTAAVLVGIVGAAPILLRRRLAPAVEYACPATVST